MKKRGWALRGALIFAAVLIIALFCRVTVVPDAPVAGTMNGDGALDVALSVAEQYCLDNWETKVLPTIGELAIAPAAFAAGLRGDLDALGAQHATRANETSPWSFCVAGTVKVLGVENADSKTKTRLLVDAEPYDGEPDMKVQTSSVIKTNAIRDAVGFLKLDDFENQVEFAELTKAFNARIQADVLKDLDTQALVGKEIELTGCVSLQKADDEALVVPVMIKAVAP